MTTRKCKKCGKVKPISEFDKHTRDNGVYYSHKCKECRRLYERKETKKSGLILPASVVRLNTNSQLRASTLKSGTKVYYKPHEQKLKRDHYRKRAKEIRSNPESGIAYYKN